jgi:hypothetical protein
MVAIWGWDTATWLLVAHLVTTKRRPTPSATAMISAASMRASALAEVGVKMSWGACRMGRAGRYVSLIRAAR